MRSEGYDTWSVYYVRVFVCLLPLLCHRGAESAKMLTRDLVLPPAPLTPMVPEMHHTRTIGIKLVTHFWRAGAIRCAHAVRLRKIGIYVEHYSMVTVQYINILGIRIRREGLAQTTWTTRREL